MINTVNRVTLIGFAEKDPEIRHLQFGQVCKFVVRTTERWNDRNTNEPREVSQWNRVSVYVAPLINTVMSELKAGMLVYVEGRMQTNRRQDDSGQERTFTEVAVRAYHGSVTPLGVYDEATGTQTSASSGSPQTAPYRTGGQQPSQGYAPRQDFAKPARSQPKSPEPQIHGGEIEDDEVPF